MTEVAVAPVSVEEKKEEVSIADLVFGSPPQNRVNVASADRSLAFYLQRARKILRLEDECTIGGLGQAIGYVVEVVEILKREKVAVVAKVETTMVEGSELRTPFRKPKLEVTLNRGELATLVADYRRRKVTEIFESRVDIESGVMPVDELLSLDIAGAFQTQDEGRQAAEEFLQGKTELDLCDFIRYSSLLIHPLLLEVRFKEGCAQLLPSSVNESSTDTKEDPVTQG